MMMAGVDRYMKAQNQKPKVKRTITLDEKIARAECECGSALGILKATPNGANGRAYRSALFRLRQLMGKKLGISDHWSLATVYDLPSVQTPTIPVGMSEDMVFVDESGMLVFEWSDLAKALHPYDTSASGWDADWREANQKVLDWLNERPLDRDELGPVQPDVGVRHVDRPAGFGSALLIARGRQKGLVEGVVDTVARVAARDVGEWLRAAWGGNENGGQGDHAPKKNGPEVH